MPSRILVQKYQHQSPHVLDSSDFLHYNYFKLFNKFNNLLINLMLTTHPDQTLDTIINEIIITSRKLWIFPYITCQPDSFTYVLSMRKFELRGIVFKYKSHTNRNLNSIDNCITANSLPTEQNDYVCLRCLASSSLFVNYTFDDIELFCPHTSYFEDEIQCIEDE
jgi:hypothetical protein